MAPDERLSVELSEAGRRRKAAMLSALTAEVDRVSSHRAARRRAAAGALALVLLLVLAPLSLVHPGRAPSPIGAAQVARDAPTTSPAAPIVRTVDGAAAAFTARADDLPSRWRVVHTAPAGAVRVATRSRIGPLEIDDRGLTEALAQAGSPRGVVRIDGEVRLDHPLQF